MAKQIAVYRTHKQVLDFQDLLEPDPKRSKACAERSRSIAITLLNYAEGQGATETVHAYLNTDDARLLFHLIVNDSLPEEGWSDFVGGTPPAAPVKAATKQGSSASRNWTRPSTGTLGPSASKEGAAR